MDPVWTSSLKGTWIKAQKAQNNKFVENRLENWVQMN